MHRTSRRPPLPMPSVRSEPLKDGQPAEKIVRPPSGGMWALSVALLVFGLIGWLAGGKYTVEGWVVALNMFARWIGVDGQLATPRGWVLIACVIGVSLVYSKVELLAWRKNVQRMPVFWLAWMLIGFTDVGSTLLGVLTPASDAPAVFVQIAAVLPLAILWALVLTVAPEYMILGAWRLLRR